MRIRRRSRILRVDRARGNREHYRDHRGGCESDQAASETTATCACGRMHKEITAGPSLYGDGFQRPAPRREECNERAWRVILETDLRMLGYKVSMAEDADQALELAQSDGPEVAIIDLMLPEPMDGWGLLNELRARGQKVPVIFYTAYPVFPSGTDDPDVVGYMSKAVDRADLYALLPPAIRRSRERRVGGS